MTVNSPIKDVRIIEQIKELYKKKYKSRDLLLFMLAINTGYGLQDLLKLNIEDVKNKSYLCIGNDRSIPLSKELQEMICQEVEGKGLKEPLFKTIHGHRLERTYVSMVFKDICRELGIADKYSVISWRKTFAYHYYKKYNDLSFLQWFYNQSKTVLTLDFIEEYENMNLRFREGVGL